MTKEEALWRIYETAFRRLYETTQPPWRELVAEVPDRPLTSSQIIGALLRWQSIMTEAINDVVMDDVWLKADVWLEAKHSKKSRAQIEQRKAR
jgi:hypothetical protein